MLFLFGLFHYVYIALLLLANWSLFFLCGNYGERFTHAREICRDLRQSAVMGFAMIDSYDYNGPVDLLCGATKAQKTAAAQEESIALYDFGVGTSRFIHSPDAPNIHASVAPSFCVQIDDQQDTTREMRLGVQCREVGTFETELLSKYSPRRNHTQTSSRANCARHDQMKIKLKSNNAVAEGGINAK